MPVLSVIVPVYNMEKDGALQYCLDSLIAQTLDDTEIIAVDDRSTDGSLGILNDYEIRYPGKVKVIASPENRRQGGARNLGLAAAEGKYIGFLDADDWLLPDTFESMVTLAEKTGADAVGIDLCRVSEQTMVPAAREVCNDASVTGIFDEEKRRRFIMKTGPVVTKIYARKIFFDRPFSFPEKIAYEDNAVALELAMRINHYEHIPEAKYFYYQRPGSTTHQINRKGCEDRMLAMRIMLEYAKKNGSLEIYHDEVEYIFTRMFYITTLLSYMQSDIKRDKAFICSLGREMIECFPDFRSNHYYIEKTDAEEKKWVDMQLKSTGYFVFYYDLKKTYRRLRYGKR
ncbi:MAG: glycosyltransferase [Lachnospiraceae bacterium]|nr:glycosyltransferase [Lachnospiraceae bacterium]